MRIKFVVVRGDDGTIDNGHYLRIWALTLIIGIPLWFVLEYFGLAP